MKILREKEPKKKLSQSHYDFIKIRVWVNQDNFYILSRFIFSRLLNVTGIPYGDSMKIGFAVKKSLVEGSKYDITQSQLEKRLYEMMRKYGYGNTKIRRFKLMLTFHNKRIPILIFVFGTGNVGKTDVANRLARRLNISTVLQTDLVFDLYSQTIDKKGKKKCWLVKYENDVDLVNDYKEQTRQVRDALEGDIKKCFSSGKSIVIEGTLLDPTLYGDVFKKYSINLIPEEEMKTDTVDLDGQGIILAFYITNRTKSEVIWEQAYASKQPKGLDLSELKHNYSAIKSYLEDQKVDYEVQKVAVNHLKLKKALKTIQYSFLAEVEKFSHMFYKEGKKRFGIDEIFTTTDLK